MAELLEIILRIIYIIFVPNITTIHQNIRKGIIIFMSLLASISQIRTPFLDDLFLGITALGEEIFVIVVICTIYWCFNKRLALLTGFIYFFSALLVQGLKITFRVDRPWIIDPNVVPVTEAMEHATGYSFPSGHTQSGAAVFSTLAVKSKKRAFSVAYLVLAVLVAFSRMYLGVHTFTDVIVSLIFTAIICFLFCLYEKRLFSNSTSRLVLSITLCAVSVLLMAYSYYLFYVGTIEQHYATDCFKASGAAFGFALGFFLESEYIKFKPTAFGLPKQILKLIVGLATTVILLEGIKIVLGTSLFTDALRYFVVIFWAMAGYPFLFSKLKKR